jgi:pilus assembly protein CpaB
LEAVSGSKRRIALGLAFALALVATFALWRYARGLESKAFAGVETVRVLVAKDAIPAGMSAREAASQGRIETTTIPSKVRAEGAVTSVDQLGDRVAAVTILKGEQIAGPRFVVPGEAKGILPIPQDRQAISVQVALPPGVGGFVQPGDRVSVIGQVKVPAGTTEVTKVQFLLQDVGVLAVGQRVANAAAPPSSDSSKDKGDKARDLQDSLTLTLAVTATEAEKVVYAVLDGQVYFTLLPPGSKPAATTGRTRDNVFLP